MDDSSPRRDVLGGIAGGLAAGTVLHALLPEATASPGTALDRDVSADATDPPAEQETPYAVYQYVPVRGDFRRTLPINVVCPLEEASFDELIDVFEAARWYHRPAENARYAYNRETDTWVRSHWSGAESLFGVASRLHVRCWKMGGFASIQAHIDTPPSPHHRVQSFAAAAAGVAELFWSAGWEVNPEHPETISLQNAQAPDHDGRALILRL